jgi:hypothetical protein
MVKKSIEQYIEKIGELPENELPLEQIGLPFDKERGLELLKDIYLPETGK